MKLTKIFSALLLVLVTFGCSKDDNTESYDYSKDNLVGTYSLTAFTGKKIETVKVNGFDVVTTTVSTGDTFDVTYKFDATNTLTTDGTFRLLEVKTQSGQTNESATIVVLNEETIGYSVNEVAANLTIGTTTYKVRDFSTTGFKINLEKTDVEPNGDSTVYTEEWTFKK